MFQPIVLLLYQTHIKVSKDALAHLLKSTDLIHISLIFRSIAVIIDIAVEN